MNRTSLLSLMLLSAVACARHDAAPPPESRVRLAVEGRSNANASVAAHEDLVAVAWSASTSNATDVYAAVSQDGGRTFSAPVRVNDIAGDARINSELPPRVAIVPRASGPELVVVWSTQRPEGARLLWSNSTDGGMHFAASSIVPGSVGAGSRGWQSVAVDSAGRVYVMWLDHRDVPPMDAAHHHGAPAASPADAANAAAARAAFSSLYFTSLSDTAASIITRSVCYCCKTSLVARGGALYGVWRHVFPGSVRDIAFTSTRDGGRTFSPPTRVSSDGWQIDGCPENGPAIAVDGRGRAHVAWATPPDGKSETPLGIFYAAADSGGAFGERIAMPTHGPAAHAQIAATADGSSLVAWDEIVGTARHVGLARVDRGGVVRRLWEDTPVPGGWPILAAAGDRSLIGWVSGTGTGSAIVLAELR